MYIDSHTHLSKEYYENIEEVIKSARQNQVNYLIVSCCTKSDIEEGLTLLKQFSNIYLTIGLHPSESLNYNDDDIKWIEETITSNDRIIGVGEIGLDYYYGKENIEDQKALFCKQLKMAERLSLPVVIHSRDATLDTQNILSKFNVKGIIHCFNGSFETANWYIDKNYLLGIGGVLTFKNSKLPAIVKKIPLNHIVLETDSPYLSPEPFRGKRNESKNIVEIAKKIAEIKNVSLEEVGKITTNNIVELFDLNNIL